MTQPVKLPPRSNGEADTEDPGTALTGDFLFENIPAMIWIKDTENNVIKVNRWAAKAMGRSAEELAGKSEWNLRPERTDTYFEDDKRVIESKQPIYGIIERVEIDSHEELWVVTDKIPILDRDDEVKGIVVITRDISTQKEAEAKMVEGQERLELALWGAEVGSWDLCLKSEELVFDERASRILGCSEDQNRILFASFLELIEEEDLPLLSLRLKQHIENEEVAFEVEWRTRAIESPTR